MLGRKNLFTAVDLFCGAGGMAFGLTAAGGRVVFAADRWNAAVSSYNLNFRHTAKAISLSWDSKLPDADIFIGGPPCQGFSSAGMRRSGDARNTLVAVFAHLVAVHKPKAFVFENVEGFLTGDQGHWVVDLLRPLIEAGYCLGLRKVNAANYGVPQHRKRVLVIGGLGWYPGFPLPSHKAYGAPGAELVAHAAPPCPTVAEALYGLPAACVNEAGEHSASDHSYRCPNAVDLQRYQALKPGQTMRDLPPDLWHDTYRKRAFRRVRDGTPTERRGGAPVGIRRLDPCQPSKAITSGSASEFLHPFEHRNLTIRECARLQTFPDEFRFSGNKAEKLLQIGNAVPPRLAAAVISHVAEKMPRLRALQEPSGLFEFTATFSTGMSPALQKTLAHVNSSLAAGSSAWQAQKAFFEAEL